MSRIDVDDIITRKGLKDVDPAEIKARLNAIENVICAYTNNNFVVRYSELEAPSIDGDLFGTSDFLKVHDRVIIVASGNYNKDKELILTNENCRRYDIEKIDVARNKTKLDKKIYDCDYNDLYKVEYPEDVIEGIIDMLDWKINVGSVSNSGIASETISRHSISYQQKTPDNFFNGYPFELLQFLTPYQKMKF